MAKKTANQLREEARILMDKAKELENQKFVAAGRLAHSYWAGKLDAGSLKQALSKLFAEEANKEN